MKLSFKIIGVSVAATLLLAGAALAQETTAPAAAPAAEAASPAAPAAATDATPAAAAAADGAVGAPPAGKGQIVFFRPSRFGGMALSFTVRENDADLGHLPNGHYFVQNAEPGIHEYIIGRNDKLRIEVEAGETYYAQNNIAMGIMAGRAVLVPTDKAAFDAALPHMHLSDPIQH